ncbi:MAG: hypothetical protein IPH07_11545 [Deltaproteobacteria bacterium]|nr:hypothetical protein [Deltaproteobacteria bacterium]MBK8720355.1 hypothetical protein [Deltaproteobacteria bacterium]MBP7285503.1 hypothetical protein [Nannocystaceae bacterium]
MTHGAFSSDRCDCFERAGRCDGRPAPRDFAVHGAFWFDEHASPDCAPPKVLSRARRAQARANRETLRELEP